jgi:hypothetical protein
MLKGFEMFEKFEGFEKGFKGLICLFKINSVVLTVTAVCQEMKIGKKCFDQP